jgi:hypothetical protein
MTVSSKKCRFKQRRVVRSAVPLEPWELNYVRGLGSIQKVYSLYGFGDSGISSYSSSQCVWYLVWTMVERFILRWCVFRSRPLYTCVVDNADELNASAEVVKARSEKRESTGTVMENDREGMWSALLPDLLPSSRHFKERRCPLIFHYWTCLRTKKSEREVQGRLSCTFLLPFCIARFGIWLYVADSLPIVLYSAHDSSEHWRTSSWPVILQPFCLSESFTMDPTLRLGFHNRTKRKATEQDIQFFP